ncbi:MAG TPA: transferrin receptor-like dimerization domain-containing protein [Caulobacteraceae bacterium]|jgi:N-acetylated-alpha-linked acidic dipeptidase|nr:transferrin receptor-like dimerization domain-containing protein [Caulobacteraceae bacterium]
MKFLAATAALATSALTGSLSAQPGAVSAQASAQAGAMVGFSPASAAAERALEARFDRALSAEAIRERMRIYAAEPNQVGSPHDKANAEAALAALKSWGWDAHMEVFQVLYPTPREQALELVGPQRFAATLTEPGIPGDSSEHQQGGLPAYLAFGGEGDVTAPLVYVNYGMPADYEALARMGVEVKGKIVIARYGAGWRGLKPKLAYEHGAVGCIIYSDPADDGYATADPYPNGPSRPERGLQRGSVMDMPVEAGDPLTPGYGAVEGAKRIPREEARTILKIPAIPISWGDAQHFLSALQGPVAPHGWRGSLPITYHVGGGEAARVHLLVRSDWNIKPLYDVIAKLPGAREPDQWVVRGNHRDGWVFGAEDPLSGNTAMMEEAKSLGALYKSGWRPARTIVYASWDGEEPGLLGSTEWAEAHDRELKAKAVAYINSDGNGRGFLQAESSYSLNRLIDQTAKDVRDPETGASVAARAEAFLQVRAAEADARPELKTLARRAREWGALPVGDLGSGSDYSPFLQHLGVASINLGYGGEGENGGVYHSAYDTFEHYDRFGDPGFHYGVALAQTAGRLVLRTANADLDPYAFTPLARTVAEQVEELKTEAKTERERAASVDALLDAKSYALAADPTKRWADPPRIEAAPNLDFGPLDAAATRLSASATAYDAAAARPASPAHAAAADALLQGEEQQLTDPQGLPGRPWYVNLAYAPGLLTGYGSKTLPGVREAIESRRWPEAQAYIGRTAAALDRLSARIDAAAQALAR